MNKKYELIEEITLTEDTAEIVRTQEPDGTPYNFKSVLILGVVHPSTGSQPAYCEFALYSNNVKKYTMLANISANSYSGVALEASELNGLWGIRRIGSRTGQSNFSSAHNNSLQSVSYPQPSIYDQKNYFDTIDKISLFIYKQYGDYEFLSDSKFWIYAVRA